MSVDACPCVPPSPFSAGEAESREMPGNEKGFRSLFVAGGPRRNSRSRVKPQLRIDGPDSGPLLLGQALMSFR